MQNHVVRVHHNSTTLRYTDNISWMQIQRNTFTNWLNEQLKTVGVVIQDLRTDFADGVNLIRLVETLQGRNVKAAVKKPQNQYEKFQNVTVALDAIRTDGVRIVNIGKSCPQGNKIMAPQTRIVTIHPLPNYIAMIFIIIIIIIIIYFNNW